MHIQTQTMPMQTRSMTRRAGEPHDLEAFHSYAGYAEPDFEAHLPPKKRHRFLDWDEDSDDEPSFTPSDDEEDSQATIVDDEEDSFEAATGSSDAHDPNHFCPSWVKCCEDNLAKKPAALRRSHAGGGGAHLQAETSLAWSTLSDSVPALPPLPRWPELLATFRPRFTRSQWRLYIGEICHNISYENASDDSLTTEEYAAAHDFMHGRL